jgi:hypothetical protein
VPDTIGPCRRGPEAAPGVATCARRQCGGKHAEATRSACEADVKRSDRRERGRHLRCRAAAAAPCGRRH